MRAKSAKALRLNRGTDDSRTMKTIDLRSDTITQPTDEMIEAIVSAHKAGRFGDDVIGEDEVEWLDDDTLRTSEDVIIHDLRLRKIFDHKLTFNENRYHTLDEDYERRALMIRSNDHRRAFVAGESITNRKRNSRKGMTLMKVIAEELGMTPRMARGILRSVMKKPEQGWAWKTATEVARIKAILQGEPLKSVTVDFSTCKEQA